MDIATAKTTYVRLNDHELKALTEYNEIGFVLEGLQIYLKRM